MLMVLLAALMYRAPLFEGASLYFRDLQIFFAPMKEFLARSLLAGQWPLWNPDIQMGTPFMADLQSGVFYPPSVLFMLFELPRAMAVSLALHLVIAQAGVYLLARHYGFGRIPALAGAVLYGLGGWMTSSANMLTLAHSAAWVPWTVLACERLWLAPGAGRIAVAAIVIALQMLSGWPEMCIMIALILLVRRLATPGILSVGWLGATLLAVLIACGLFAPQGLASWEAFGQSVRVGGMSEAQLFEFSATKSQLASLLFPPPLAVDDWNILQAYPDGHVPVLLSLYVGWAAALLALLGLRGARRHVLVWLTLAGVGVFLALGRENPLAMAVLRLVNIFRSPEKYLFLLHLGGCMLVVAGCARLLAALPGRRAMVAGAGVVVALSLELLWVNGRINLLAPPGYYDLEETLEARIVAQAPGRVYATTVAAARTESVRELYARFREVMSANLGSIGGIGYVNGVSFLRYLDHKAVLGLLGAAPGTALARRLGFLGTRYVLTDDPSYASSYQWNQLARPVTPLLWELRERAPYLGFPSQVVAAEDTALASYSVHPAMARGEAATVAPGHPLVGGRFSGRVRADGVAAGRVEAVVASPTGGLVVLRESHYPGWRVSVDGEQQPMVRANRFFMGVAVPPGEHRIAFRYQPTYWTAGWAAAGVAGAILLVLGVIALRQRRASCAFATA